MRTVDLSHCRLESLPEALAELPALAVLSVRGNAIRELDPNALPATLEECDVAENALEGVLALAGAADRFVRLKRLDASGNVGVVDVDDALLAAPRLDFLILTDTRCDPAALSVKPSFAGYQRRRKERLDKELGAGLTGDTRLFGIA